MFYIFSSISIVVIALVLFFNKASKGRMYKLYELKRPIDDLLKRGYNGGLLFIKVKGSKDFVQLRKYILKENEYGIEMSFPNLKWSEHYFQKLKDYCVEKNETFKITKGSDGTEFLDIDFCRDSEKAFSVIKNILENIFIKKGGYFVLLQNAHPWDVEVCSPNASIQDISINENISQIKREINSIKGKKRH